MITLPRIPEGVIVLPNIVGCVEKLQYSGHYVVDKDKFQELDPQVYLEIKGIIVTGVLIIEQKQWIIGLYNTRIMDLLDIPHFGHDKDVKNYVKQLLELVHGGILWLYRPI